MLAVLAMVVFYNYLLPSPEPTQPPDVSSARPKDIVISSEIIIPQPLPPDSSFAGNTVSASNSIAQAPPPAGGEEVSAQSKDGELLIESFRRGDYRRAVEIFGMLSGREKAEMLPLAGIAYYRVGDSDTSKRLFENSLRQKETFVALKFLAFIYYENDDLGRSRETAEKALSHQKDPELTALIERLGRELKAQGSFIEERVLHFKVLYDGYEHGALARKVLEMLDDAYNKIGVDFAYYPSEPITVILYTRESFFDTTRMPEWSGGLYDGKIRIPVAGAERRPELLRRILHHEYTHAVIRRMAKHPPLWLNEGLAEYFSGAGGKTGQLIPLKELESSFLGFDPATADIAYRESCSAVSYLIEKYGLYAMKRLLLSIGEGKDLNSAFSGAFGISYDGFVSTWGR